MKWKYVMLVFWLIMIGIQIFYSMPEQSIGMRIAGAIFITLILFLGYKAGYESGGRNGYSKKNKDMHKV